LPSGGLCHLISEGWQCGKVVAGERGDQAKHRANLVQAMRDSKTKLYCPVSLGLKTNVAITLGVRSFRERKVYGWNAGEQKAVVF
jgi:hypothetical protein